MNRPGKTGILPARRLPATIRRTAVLIGVCAALAGCSADGSAAEGRPVYPAAQLNERVPELMRRYDIPGAAVALIQNGEMTWSGAYGYADRKAGRAMNVDAVVRAESISKSLSAWGIMTLVERDLVELDEPVQSYLTSLDLPQPPGGAPAPTVRQVLSNSGGFGQGTVGPAAEYAPGEARPSAAEYLAAEAAFVQAPGSGFIYSNTGFNLLDVLVQDVTGQSFAEYMQSEVLEPLGMKNADYSWRPEFAERVPLGYEMDGTPVPPYVYAAGASGGLLASVEDLARFVQAGMAASRPHSGSENKPDLLDRTAVAALYEPLVPIPGMFGLVADGYGFGHFVETLPDGRRAVWHGGQGHGWMTHFHSVPESGEAIVIVTNSQRSWPFMAALLGDWATGADLGSVKFSRITRATRAAWIIVALLAGTAVLRLWQLGVGLLRGRRRVAAPRGARVGRRLLQLAGAAAIVGVILWRASLPYVFEVSILPTVIPWAVAALMALAAALLLGALTPPRDRPAGVAHP